MLSGGRFLLWVVAFAFVLLLPHSTLASDYSTFGDGNDLLKDCKAYTDLNLLDMRSMSDKDIRRASARGDPISGLQCLAYVMGVIDDRFNFRIDEMASTGAFDPARYFCFPHGVTPDQAVRVIVKWLGDHPARLHEDAIKLALDALKENFPCHKNR
jgi:Rap1a immunity proteins